MELMKASLDKLYRKVYATPGRQVPEEVLREIAISVSYNNPVEYSGTLLMQSQTGHKTGRINVCVDGVHRKVEFHFSSLISAKLFWIIYHW